MSRSKQGFDILKPNIAPQAEPYLTTKCCDRISELISSNPSLFGRLWVIAKFRSPITGVYSHPLSDEFGPVVVDAALRRVHRDLFAGWLNLRLQEQERELRLWLACLGRTQEDREKFLEDIAADLNSLIPPDHLEPEAMLFARIFAWRSGWFATRPEVFGRKGTFGSGARH